MAKLTLNDVANITGAESTAITTINGNSDLVEAALENTLSRDGTTPNTMSADIDMNSNDLLNVGTLNGSAIGDLAATITVGTVSTGTAGSSVIITDTGSGNDSIFNFTIPRGDTGASGADGADGTDGTDGTVTGHQGDYAGGTTYNVGEIVLDQGSSWVALQETTGNAPPGLPTTSNTYWQLLAKVGASGAGTGDLLAANNLSDVDNTATARTNLGIPSNFLQIANNLSDLDNVATARTNLGIPANFLQISNNLSDLGSASTARTNLVLGNVDNTSDANKPVSTATQTALDAKLALAGGTLTGNLILNADPTVNLGAATKQYVDNNSGSGGLVLLETITASSDASLDFTGFVDSSEYCGYKFVFNNVLPATDGTSIAFRVSTDGGSTWDSTASDYSYASIQRTTGFTSNNANNDKGLLSVSAVGNVAADETGLSGYCIVSDLSEGYPHFIVKSSYVNETGNLALVSINTYRNSATAVDAVQFFAGSGNITSGTVTLFGISK